MKIGNSTYKILLVDATVYEKKINNELLALKKDYFKIKTFVRDAIIGQHIYPTQRTFSTGLLRIGTILNRLHYEVEYVHLDDFINTFEIVISNSKLIAFTCVCPTIPICNNLAHKIKRASRNITIAVGGAGINVALELTKKNYKEFDKYIKGYDIDAVCQLLECDQLKLLNNSPYVDYSILPYPLNQYDINIFSTLGCPFSCNYCQDGLIPYFENVLDGGLYRLKNMLPSGKLVHFFDSILGYSMERLLHICEYLSKKKHNFILSCDIRAEFITRESVWALEKAGFREIRIGLETADQMVLLNNNRQVLPQLILDKLKIVRDYSNLYITVYSVSGLPSSTINSLKKTKDLFQYLLEEKKVDEIKNAQFVPYPMDNVNYINRGIYIADYNWENYDRQSYPVYYTLDMSRDQIWQAFIDTAKVINQSWLKGNGFEKISDLKNAFIYPEYIVKNYLGDKNGDS